MLYEPSSYMKVSGLLQVAFPPGKVPCTSRVKGLVDPKDCLEDMENRKVSVQLNPDSM
jgi:hypothetical protein